MIILAVSLPFQFVVVRFFPSDVDEDVCFEVSLASWLCGPLNDEMIGKTRWPPSGKPATPLIKMQSNADPNWKTYKVEVMRYYGEKSVLFYLNCLIVFQ